MLVENITIWGCMPEFNTTTGYVCPHDISNAASMWVGLVLGLILGGVITWWVYNRQKKISEKQDHVLAHMLKLERRMIDMERRISEKILSSDKKIDSSLENNKQ